MKGIIGILMVIAVMYPPDLNGRRIPVVAHSQITATAEAASGASATASKKAKKEKKKKKKKGGKLPEGAISGAAELAQKMGECGPFAATVDYDVTLPMSSDEIVYTLQLASQGTKTDRLMPCNYLIDWQLNYNGTDSEGFVAYFDGNHYRYRDYRLQEYHYYADPTPFETSNGGVQATGQFVNLLPQSLSAEIGKMLTDSNFAVHFTPDTLVANGRRVALTAIQTVNDHVGRRFVVVADMLSGLPVEVSNEYNPGEVSEQSNRARYSYSEDNTLKAPESEGDLQARYPEIFSKYRENGNRIEHMRGLPLPGFSLPASRYTRQKDEPFSGAAVIAIIDPAAESAGETVTDLRKAVGGRELILAFTGTNTDEVEAIAGEPQPNEHLLISARSLARDCGTEVFPTVIVVTQSGKVANVYLGVNRRLVSDVIESLTHAESGI